MLVKETYLNATENHMIGESEPFEPFTENTGELYRAMQAEYGRCVSKVYVDTDDGPKAVGWVFQGRDKYEDSDETYLREVWVTLYDRYDIETVVHADYHGIGGAP